MIKTHACIILRERAKKKTSTRRKQLLDARVNAAPAACYLIVQYSHSELFCHFPAHCNERVLFLPHFGQLFNFFFVPRNWHKQFSCSEKRQIFFSCSEKRQIFFHAQKRGNFFHAQSGTKNIFNAEKRGKKYCFMLRRGLFLSCS